MNKEKTLIVAALVLATGLGVKIISMVTEQPPVQSAPAPSLGPLPPKRPLEDLFAGTKPGLIGLPAGVQLGMKEDALANVSPELAAGGLTTPQGVVCVADVSRESRVLEAVNFLLGADLPTAERAIVGAWGEPARGRDAPDKPALFWHDEKQGLRAVLRATTAGTHLEVRRMITAASLLGAKGWTLGLESQGPFLGATLADLEKSYTVVPRAPDASAGADVMIVFPPTEYGWRDTRVYGYLSGGKLARFTVEIEFGRAPEGFRKKILESIEEKFGKAELFDAGAIGTYRVYKGERLVIVREESTFGAWHLSVEPGDEPKDAGRD